MNRPPSVVAIVEEVAAEHGFTASQLFGPWRRYDICRARFECWGRLRTELKFASGPPSLPQIGSWFGRHHTSVMNGLNRLSEIDCSAPSRVDVAA